LADAGICHILIGPSMSHAHAVASMGSGILLCAEGMNEPAGFGYPLDWRPVSDFQAQLYSGIRGDSSFAGVMVGTPTNVGEEPNNFGLQYLTVPSGPPSGVLCTAGLKYAECYVVHIYPMWFGGHKSPAYVDPVSGNIFDKQLSSDFEVTWKHKFAGLPLSQLRSAPRMITETNPGVVKTPSPGGDGIDFATQGKCLLTGFMNSFEQGYLAFCIYTFYEDGTGHGIMKGPGSPSLSGEYVHNFVSPLLDSGTHTPGMLDYSISSLPSGGMSRLFQKSDGKFELIVWNNAVCWDHAAGTPIAVAPAAVGVAFGSAPSAVNIYDPTVGTSPIESHARPSSVGIALRDYPMTIEIIP
jgi:hypothetical protein